MPDPEKRYQRDRGSTSPAARCVELGRVTKLNLDQGLDVRFRRISMFPGGSSYLRQYIRGADFKSSRLWNLVGQKTLPG